MDYTFVRLRKTTAARIRKHGTFGGTYDSVIDRLLEGDTYRKKRK